MKFVLVIHADYHVREQKKLAEVLRKKGHECWFYSSITQQFLSIEEDVFNHFPKIKKINQWMAVLKKIFIYLKFCSIYFFHQLKNVYFRFLNKIKRVFLRFQILFQYLKNIVMNQFLFARGLKKYQIDAVILSEANAEFISEIYVKAAKKLNLPCIITPFTICTSKEPAQYYYDNRDYYATKKRKKMLKLLTDDRWFLHYENKELIRLPIYKIILIELLRLAPPQPWVQESSSSAIIFAESQHTKEHYLNCGIDEQQIKVVGSINFDMLHHCQLNSATILKKISSFFDEPNKPIIVCAIPADYTQHPSYPCEFNSYFDLLSAWTQALSAQSKFNIILAPHPAIQDKDFFKQFETSHLKISLLPIHELLSIATIYIACVSATIKWALVQGIPVINYDMYHFNYTDYQKEPSVKLVNNMNEFKEVYQQMVNEYFDKPKILEKNQWGHVDGKFTESFIHFVSNFKVVNYVS